jgi:DNA-binding response OmpR family regulator
LYRRADTADLSAAKVRVNGSDPQQTILVIEDEPDVVDLLALSLRKAGGFTLIVANDGITGLKKARTEKPELVVLDLMLPGMSGLEVCKLLKSGSVTARIPILMLTAKAQEADRITGLEYGADDYVTKPFSPREVVLRIKAILRRSAQAESDDVLTASGITVDPVRHQVAVAGKRLYLTSIEFKLLRTLLQRRGRIQTRDRLLNDVWGYESVIDTRTVDTHVRRLREKLGKAGDAIETVRGVGYRFREE